MPVIPIGNAQQSQHYYQPERSKTMNTSTTPAWMRKSLCGIGLALAICAGTGCQSSIGGQILPSAYYQDDDVQYFASGPGMKLAKEAAQLKANNAEEALRRR